MAEVFVFEDFLRGAIEDNLTHVENQRASGEVQDAIRRRLSGHTLHHRQSVATDTRMAEDHSGSMPRNSKPFIPGDSIDSARNSTADSFHALNVLK